MEQETIREAVGVFNDKQQLDQAIAELEVTAFPRHDISVLGPDKDVKEKYGLEEVSAEFLEDNADAPRGVSIRPEEKTIGAGVMVGACAYLAGCAVALASQPASTMGLLLAITGGSLAGAAVGMILVFLIGSKLRSGIDKQLRNGGLLLWVRTPTIQREKIAQEILRKHGGHDVHIHSIN
jgi:hypothetical protein